jgi:hypothetical protein
LPTTLRVEIGQSRLPNERQLAIPSYQQMALTDDTRDAGHDKEIKTGPEGWREVTYSANGG